MTLSQEGLFGDRRFMVTRGDGTYLTQRELPRLATLDARTTKDVLHLSFPTRSFNVSVRTRGDEIMATLFGDKISLVDQGSAVGAWLDEALSGGGGGSSDGGGGGGPLAQVQRALFNTPAYRLLRAPDAGAAMPPLRSGAGLSDLASILLICEESLAELNRRRALDGKYTVPMGRFRPNLVVSGCGLPHAEDKWVRVRIGRDAEFRVTGPCPRCTVPDVSQQSGVRDAAGDGPMGTLKGYRSRVGAGVLFGVYLTPLNPGARVRVGDAVMVLR